MKIYSISDMHGNISDLNPAGCDIVVIAGDFAPLKGFSKWHIHDQKKWIEKKFIPWTQNFKDIEFVVIPGNHDFCLDYTKISAFHDLNWNIVWPKNIHLLINEYIEVKGLKIFGSPNVPIISYRWAFEAESDKLKKIFAKIPDNIDILVTHTPPRIPDCDIDRSLQYGRSDAFGSQELTDMIFIKKPRYVFCGHIHTGTHECITFNDSLIYNVAYVDEDYKIKFEPQIVDI